MRKNKKSMTMNVIIMMVIGLVVLAMMIYLANKYIIGTGKSAGEISGCKNQGGDCQSTPCNQETHLQVKGMGCPSNQEYCCLPKGV